jgi:hypothetical protein
MIGVPIVAESPLLAAVVTCVESGVEAGVKDDAVAGPVSAVAPAAEDVFGSATVPSVVQIPTPVALAAAGAPLTPGLSVKRPMLTCACVSPFTGAGCIA